MTVLTKRERAALAQVLSRAPGCGDTVSHNDWIGGWSTGGLRYPFTKESWADALRALARKGVIKHLSPGVQARERQEYQLGGEGRMPTLYQVLPTTREHLQTNKGEAMPETKQAVTVAATEIERACKRVGRTKGDLAHIALDRDGDLFIESVGGDEGRIAARVYMAAQGGPIDVVLDLAALRKAAKVADWIEITDEGDHVRVNGQIAGVVKRSSWPAVRRLRAEQALEALEAVATRTLIHADASELAKALGQAAWFTPKKKSVRERQPGLCGFRVSEGVLYASDGRRLLATDLPGLQDNGTYLLPGALMTAVQGAREGGVVVELVGEHIRVRRTGEAWAMELATDQAPPYEAVIAGALARNLVVDVRTDAAQLYEALAASAERSAGEYQHCVVKVSEDSLAVALRGEAGHDRVEARGTPSGVGMELVMDATHARDALGVMDGEVRIRTAEKQGPVVIEGGGKMVLLVGLRS